MTKYLLLTLLPLSLMLSACGGGSGDSGSTTQPTSPSTPEASKQPMYAQAQPVYTFGIFSSQLNNRYEHTLINDVISQTFTKIKPSTITNTSTSGDKYYLNKNSMYIQKEVNTLNQSTPSQYFISDDGSNVVTSFYNTEGVNPTIRQSMSYQRYDVSGLKVKDYIYKNLLNSADNPTSAQALSSSNTVFPKGSVVFVPGEITTLDEYYDVKVSNGTAYANFDAVPSISNYPLSKTFGGLDIRYSNSNNLAYVSYNGKVYQAWHYPEKYRVKYNVDNNYIYNSIAADTVGQELINSCSTGTYTNSASGCMF